MLVLVTGTDRRAAVDYLNRRLATAAGVFKFDPENFDLEDFKEKLLGNSLFTASYVVAARDLSELALARQGLQELDGVLTATPHQVWFLETGADNELATWLGSLADEVQTFNQPPVQEADFNPFSLTEALGARDRKRLWLLYQAALLAGFRLDDVFWKLAWQMKIMLLAATARPGEELGLKPFVAGRARRAAQNYSVAELQNLFGELVDIYHTTYPDSDDFNFRLEKFILTI